MLSSYFLLMALCLSTAYANPLTKYLFNMATRGMDPFTRTLMQSTLGGELLDMDGGSSQSSYGYNSGLGGLNSLNAMSYFYPMMSSLWNPVGSQSQYFPHLPQENSLLGSFSSNNLVQPSSVSKGNPYESADDQNTQLLTSQSATIGNPLAINMGSSNMGTGGILGGGAGMGQSLPYGMQQPFYNPFAMSSTASSRSRLFNNMFMMRFMDAFDFF